MHNDIKYRADIDGIRALAVLGVVGFHAFPYWFPGGYVGVDIFFVISGYLITNLISHDLNSNRFSLSHFYKKRIRRIFPALILVLFSAVIFSYFFLLAEDFKQFGKHLLASSLFSSNFFLWKESGYFDFASDTKPLLHLWSLAIEEQFYFVWPVALLLLNRSFYNKKFTLILLIGFSFFLNLVLTKTHNSFVFYSPLTRAWELGIGCYLALYSLPIKSLKLSPHLVSILSLIGIFSSIFLLKQHQFFPGYIALLPTLSTALLLSDDLNTIHKKVLAHPVLVKIGLMSYPLYLWHWPLLSFARIIGAEIPSRTIRILMVLLSIGLAFVTYYWIEKPIRKRKLISNEESLFFCALLGILGTFGSAIYLADGLEFRHSEVIQKISQHKFDVLPLWRVHDCYLDDSDLGDFPNRERCAPKLQGTRIMTWGDSYAASLIPGLQSLEKLQNVSTGALAANSCPPLLTRKQNIRCQKLNDSNFEFLKKNKPDWLILFAKWSDQLIQLDQLKITIEILRKSGFKNIVIFGPPPLWKEYLSKVVFAYWQKDKTRGIPIRLLYRLDSTVEQLDEAFEKEITSGGARYISTYKSFCNEKGCLIRSSQDSYELFSIDNGHLSPAGSRFLIEKIAAELKWGNPL